jgi:hypothetical protein
MLHFAHHPCGIAAYAGAMRLRSTWTDSRLDDLNGRVTGVSDRLDGLSNRVDRLQHTMIQGFIALVAIMVTGFMGLAGLIVTKL